MGAYLSEPITKKISSDEAGKNVAFGASSMQGWRVSQEDAHNCCIDFDTETSLFAVYDGHGGHEVATYCSQKLPDFIKSTQSYKNGDIPQALIDAFLGFDATLATPEIVQILKKIAGSSLPEKEMNDSCDSSEEDTVTNLKKEAEMPLEQVMMKYQADLGNSDKSHRGIASPFLRCRRSKPGCSSSGSGAGCSTSWNSNEADVSSSSSTNPETSDEKSPEKKVEKKQEPGSSDSDQILDSTSNGDTPHPPKTALPDSSEDQVSQKITSNTPQNGEKAPEPTPSVPDSSKNDNVSSSCTSSLSVLNGDSEDLPSISSSTKKAIGEHIYRALLQTTCENSEDSDTDDENDENFNEGIPDDEDEDEEDDEELDDDDDSEVDDDDVDDDGEFNMTEEPGADSGCTAVVAVLQGNELFVANAGDSRCVLCRDGEAMELSLDHKPEDQPEMARIVKAGGKVTSDGRVNGGLNLSRALGDHAYKQNTTLKPEEQMISAMPDIKRVTIDPTKDEFMVLACDGIWNFMSSGDVVKFVRERLRKNDGDNLSKICEELFDHCLAPDTMGDGTGCDNMTAVIVKFKNSQEDVAKNNGDAVTKKRPLENENSEENVKNEESMTDECKRAKMETV